MPELALAAEANHEKREEELHMLAWHAANVMNCWVSKGKKIQPSDLLPGKKKRTFTSRAEMDAYIKEQAAHG